MPRARGDDPLILVGLETRLAEASHDAARAATRPLSRYPSDGPELYEVTTARVRNVEFITREWRAAWDTANECLRQIVATSQTAPGEQKRRQIAEALEKAAGALNLMRKAKIGDDWLAKARPVEPAATVIRSYQRRMGDEWQSVLEDYAERLRISIRTALPPRMPLLDRVKLLAASASPAEFVDTIKESWSEDLLEERLMYSSSLGRPVFMHEVPDMAPALFERLRAEARRQIAFRNEARRNTPTRQTSSTQPVEELHVVVREASRDLLAEKLVLAGLVVEKVLDEPPAADLKPGDLIVGYDATGVAVMGPDDLERSAWWLVQKARHGGELTVLRGKQLLTITLPKSGSPSRR